MASRDPRLPDFLLIGAMKAGSTSLSHDLSSMSDVFMPSVKEPHFLCKDSVLTPQGSAQYARLFAAARDDQLCGEGSTGYSKLPQARGIPRRARALLGPDLRIIYIVRNPVDRALSHHYHESRSGRMPIDPDRAIAEFPVLVQYGQYMRQLDAWLQEFPADRIHVVPFEEYVARPVDELARLRAFLGLPAQHADAADGAAMKNRGEDALVSRAGLGRLKAMITRSEFYKVWIHPRLPGFLTRAVKAVALTRAPSRPPAPRAESVEYLISQLTEDADRLRTFLGREAPLWTWEAPASKANAERSGASPTAPATAELAGRSSSMSVGE